MKKLLSILLCFCLLLSLAACKKTEGAGESQGTIEQSTSTRANSLRLLYSASDSFNPYTAQTDLNRDISLLIFDSLVKLNNSFEAEYVLADSITVKKSVCTVILKDISFSDGSPVTAADVVYSYNLAKKSQTEYAYNLYEVKSVKADGDKKVIFNLTRNDIYFERLLDFPILKSGTDKKTNSDGIEITPIGSGRYIPNNQRNTLSANENYYGKKAGIEKISLVNAPDPEAVSHYVEIGATDIYYTDISDGSIVRMSGKKSTVNLNNLVYIGVNHKYGQLSSVNLRNAISSALDRTVLCREAYHNNATPATGFFNPAVKEVAAVQNIQTIANTEISIENLEEIGYNKMNGKGLRVNSSNNGISLTLTVNKENAYRVAAAKLISEQLKAVGIEITVIKLSYKEYVKALESGNFQLYLGEIKVLSNMDLSELVVAGGSCAYGISKPDKNSNSNGDEKQEAETESVDISDIYDAFYSGSGTVTDIAVALQTKLPVIPVCFRSGLLFHNAAVKNVGEASASDIYFSISEYTIKK